MQSTKLVGKDLFYKRLEKKMKQEELCRGICSVSYLSKIENDRLVPSADILRLLCERLGIEEDSVRDMEEDVADKLDKWNAALRDTEREAAAELYGELEAKLARISNAEILNYYNVLRLRYKVLVRDMQEAEQLAKDLKKAAAKYAPFHRMLYTYVCGIMACIKGEWGQGIHVLTEAEKQARELKYFEAGMYYNLALAHSRMHNVYKSLYFAQIAMDGLQNDYMFRVIINCQIIMAINYTRLGEYERALQTYEKILQAAASFSDRSEIYAIVYHNMGHVHSHQHNLESAIKWYLKSLGHKQSGTDSYLVTLQELVSQYLSLNLLEEAKSWITVGVEIALQGVVEEHWKYIFQAAYYKYCSNSKLYKEFLEKEAIPFFKDRKSWHNLKKVYLQLAEYFEMKLEYKESARYYKLAVQIAEQGREEKI
ncbi:helix-turn-helix transcriptional regulator [Ectobacillus ponti]|uniref:Tetratricopeptide repeat protein n=1 Tax=Ectobacillus ponti TaxID=2961894 RepID=A0AA41X642_9BACI|nr:helix-turn-helix transcriptional regulator [Ectobacillus ponti]MCP8969482.1 tetratricopeptide repeat protein [Ectobacillus ponti]